MMLSKLRLQDYLNRPVYVRLPNWIGDACMCLPALHLLQSQGLNLILCGKPWARDLLAELHPCQFINIEKKLNDNIRQLKASKVSSNQLGIVFTNSFSSALSFKLAGIKTVGYRSDARRLLLRWSLNKTERHEVDTFYQLARHALIQWGVDQQNLPDLPPSELQLPLNAGHFSMAQQALEQGMVTTDYILLAPTVVGMHKGQIKAWKHFNELSLRLTQLGWTCVICPPPNEIESAKQATPHARLLPSLSLGGFAALAKRAALVVCNDSGSSHVAASVNANLITIMGVTSPKRTGPWSPTAHCIGEMGRWPTVDEVITYIEQHQVLTPITRGKDNEASKTI